MSVILPTKGRPDLFTAALASVTAQTFTDFEVIVVEDGGARYAADANDDERVTVVRHEINRGVVAAVLSGLAQARGRFVSFANDDDLWEVGLLASLVRPLRDDDTLVAAFSDHHVMDSGGEVSPRLSDANTRLWGRERLAAGRHEPFVTEALIDGAVPIAQCTILRRSAVDWDRLTEDSAGAWDRMVAYLACRQGGAAFYVPERLARYRVHEGAQTKTGANSHLHGAISVYRAAVADPLLEPWMDALCETLAEFLRVRAARAIRAGDLAAARADLAEIGAIAPGASSAKLTVLRALASFPTPVASTAAKTVDVARATLVKLWR